MDARQTKIATRGRIIGMRESGLSPSEISRELGISRSVVYRWIRRWEEEGTLNDRSRSGAPRKTTADQDAQIRETVEANPFTNAVKIQEELQLPVTSRTVRKRLHADGIHHRTPAVKERLTERHRQGRLQFAQQHIDKDLDYWGRVIWTDEKTFCSTAHGKLHCWRRDNTRYVNITFFTLHFIVS